MSIPLTQPSLSATSSDQHALSDLLQTAHHQRQTGQLAQAKHIYQSIVSRDPHQPDALHYLGLIAYQEHNYLDAERLIRLATEINPNSANYFINLGQSLSAQGRYAESIVCQRRALELEPNNAIAHFNLGVAQISLNLIDQGVQSYCNAIAANPKLKEAFYNLGTVFRLREEHAAAIPYYQQAIDLDDSYIDAYNNLAVCQIAVKNFDAVAKAALKVIALDPNHANSYFHLAIACQEQGNLIGSEVFHERAAVINQERGQPNATVLCSLGLLYLALGKLPQGWAGFEYRWSKEVAPEPMRQFPYPWWQGESLYDKTILVWGEQGVGDQILFSSLYQDLVDRAKLCVFACAKKLIPLFQLSFPGALIVDIEAPNQWNSATTIDLQSAAGSTARWLRPDLSSFPKRTHFLQTDHPRIDVWKKKLAQLDSGRSPKINVGIGWRSSNMSGNRALYCTQIEQWQAIFAVQGVRFVNLQYDECSAELERVRQQFGIDIVQFNEVDLMDDLVEAAALTKALDLVISAPTTTAILAGSLGVPTWMMLSGFYWHNLGEKENPWYPAVRGFLKNWNQAWEVVIAEIAAQLSLIKHPTILANSTLNEVNALSANEKNNELYLPQSLSELTDSVEQNPSDHNAWARLGFVQMKLAKYAQSEASFARAIELYPEFTQAIFNLGTTFWLQGKHEQVIACCLRVVQLDSNNIDAHNNIAVSAIELKQFDLVAQHALKIIQLDPENALAYFHLGLACQEQGNLEAAITFFERAAVLDPSNNNNHFARSLVMLALGKLDQGWAGYEFRWIKQTGPVPYRYFAQPKWQGESLVNKTILIWGEQGVGDQILFASLYSQPVTEAKLCILACTKKLIPLFQSSFPKALVLDIDSPAQLESFNPHIDVQSAAGSMARWLRPTIAGFPQRSHFLAANQERVDAWRSRLVQLDKETGKKLNVGISWRSGHMSGDRAFFCTQIDQWTPILQLKGVRFINLQYDDCREELERARQQTGVEIIQFPEVDLFDDLAEAAALSRSLDLVISAPTSAAILAAALGVPTWMMLSGFYWHSLGEKENCWYPSVRSFHKSWTQSWDAIINDIASELASLASLNHQ